MDPLTGIWTTFIVVQVAFFLMNTGRVHKAIELGNEFLKDKTRQDKDFI